MRSSGRDRARRRKAFLAAAERGWCEQLESRTLMDSAPLPTISELQSPGNTVVRFETNFGDIDIELFDTAAPITVANFIKYVRDGDYDRTFFHRLDDDFVLQGGLSRQIDATEEAEEIPVDAPITNEFNQSNLIRTISMARRGGQVNSATSQFFFNLANNTFLDTVDQGFTVFGRVVNDRSWQVLQDINALEISAQAAPYNELPVSADFNAGDGIQEAELVVIIDAEIIKPANVAAFYTQKYYYPEGFSGSTINEFIPLGNPSDSSVFYQVIVRSEFRRPRPEPTPGDAADPDFWYRDKVIQTSSIPGNARRGVTVSTIATNDTDLVEQGIPYAFEIWATGPLMANLTHFDFGTTTGEPFTQTLATDWTFTSVRKGADFLDFPIWLNSNDATANITISFLFENQSPLAITTTTEAFRREGLNISQITALPDGEFSIRITSDLPIVAAITQFDSSGDRFGSSSLGIAEAPSRVGVLARGDGGQATNADTLHFLNPSSAAAIITLRFSFSDGTPDLTLTPAELILQPGRRTSFDLSGVAQLAGKPFTVRYSAGATAIFASTSHRENGDELAHALSFSAATEFGFAEGFMDDVRAGNNLFETISVYNPNTAFFGTTEQDATVTIRFLYNDTFVVTETFTIAGGGRLDLDVHTLQSVLDQAEQNDRFFFSVQVSSDIPIMAQFRHFDLTLGGSQPSGGFGMIGVVSGTIIRLTDLDGTPG